MHPYTLAEPDTVASPALLFYPALIRRNLRRAAAHVSGDSTHQPLTSSARSAEVRSSACFAP